MKRIRRSAPPVRRSPPTGRRSVSCRSARQAGGRVVGTRGCSPQARCRAAARLAFGQPCGLQRQRLRHLLGIGAVGPAPCSRAERALAKRAGGRPPSIRPTRGPREAFGGEAGRAALGGVLDEVELGSTMASRCARRISVEVPVRRAFEPKPPQPSVASSSAIAGRGCAVLAGRERCSGWAISATLARHSAT